MTQTGKIWVSQIYFSPVFTPGETCLVIKLKKEHQNQRVFTYRVVTSRQHYIPENILFTEYSLHVKIIYQRVYNRQSHYMSRLYTREYIIHRLVTACQDYIPKSILYAESLYFVFNLAVNETVRSLDF